MNVYRVDEKNYTLETVDDYWVNDKEECVDFKDYETARIYLSNKIKANITYHERKLAQLKNALNDLS